jgi:hypothetical protein
VTQQILVKARKHIPLDDDVLIPRGEFAAEIGISDKTAQRSNWPTTYIGNVAYVLRGKTLRLIGESVRRRNQPRRVAR